MVSLFRYVAIILVLAGVLVYFFGHILLFAAVLVGIGFISFILNIIGITLESSGDASFS